MVAPRLTIHNNADGDIHIPISFCPTASSNILDTSRVTDPSLPDICLVLNRTYRLCAKHRPTLAVVKPRDSHTASPVAAEPCVSRNSLVGVQ